MITSPETYHGISKDHFAAFETAVQGSVTELFDLSCALWDRINGLKGKRYDFGDMDYTIHAVTVKSDDYGRGLIWKQLRFNNHSSGFWVVLQWTNPHADLAGYEQRVDFWFHGNKGSLPKTLDWKKFEDDWGYGKEDLHFKGSRGSPEDTWFASAHTLSFKHPLLAMLRWGLDEINEETP